MLWWKSLLGLTVPEGKSPPWQGSTEANGRHGGRKQEQEARNELEVGRGFTLWKSTLAVLPPTRLHLPLILTNSATNWEPNVWAYGGISKPKAVFVWSDVINTNYFSLCVNRSLHTQASRSLTLAVWRDLIHYYSTQYSFLKSFQYLLNNVFILTSQFSVLLFMIMTSNLFPPLCWLVLCPLDTSYSHTGGGNLNWEDAFIRSGCRQAC